MLVNLRMDGSREAKFSINNNSGYKNLRVRDYENPLSLDTVIASRTTFIQTLTAGDGRLFQVAPVIKSGGLIKYNETIYGTNTLNDSMTIKPGAVLTVSGTYNINKNIFIESGGEMIVTLGTILNFLNGATIKNMGGTLIVPDSLFLSSKFN